MTRVIGLVGGSGSGKTTAARFLCQHLGATEYILASPIKRIVQDLYGFSPEQLESRELKEVVDPVRGISPRNAMRAVGDALAREFGRDFLVNHTLERIAREAPRIALISDVRKLNEAHAISRFAPDRLLIRMNYIPGLEPATPGTHSTETEWGQIACDYEFEPGRADLEHLYRLLTWMCDDLDLQAVYQQR